VFLYRLPINKQFSVTVISERHAIMLRVDSRIHTRATIGWDGMRWDEMGWDWICKRFLLIVTKIGVGCAAW